MTTSRGPTRARRPPSRPPRPDRGPAVELTVQRGVAWVTLGRPAFRNRLDAELLGALVEVCERLEDAEEAHVVVLAARGGAFCAGLPPGCAWPEGAWPDGIGAVARLTKPVVAAVHGDALGWGFALALACDLRVTSRAAAFALPELEAGTLPGGGALPRLARVVGPGRALEMALLGTRIGAAQAVAWGLVTAAVPAGRLRSTVEEMAQALAARGPLALRLGKEAVVKALDLPLLEGIRLEHDLYVLLQTTADRREGIGAFLARRRPRFGAR